MRKDSTIEDIDKALPEVEDKLDEVAGKISELDDQLSNQEIGGTNLLLDSDRNITNAFKIAVYDMSEKMEKITYTLTLKGKLGKDKSSFRVYISDGNHPVRRLKYKGNNIYQGTFEGRTDAGLLKKLIIYAFPNSIKAESEIEWAKLEKGNKATPWTPAPEDIVTKSEIEKIKQAIINLGGSI